MTELLCLFLCKKLFFFLFLCNIKPKPTRPKRWRRVDGNACRPRSLRHSAGCKKAQRFWWKTGEKNKNHISAHTQHTQAYLNPVVHHLVLMPGLTFSRASWPGLNVTSCCPRDWMNEKCTGRRTAASHEEPREASAHLSAGISFTFFSSLFLYLPRRAFFLSTFFIRVHISTYVIQ